jgi:hypothetical protein
VTFLAQAWATVWGGVFGVPQATAKTPMGAADYGDPSWAVGSMWTAAQGVAAAKMVARVGT